MLQKILVPLGGSGFAECVVPYVDELCQRCEPVEIVLLQVVRLPDAPPEVRAVLHATCREQELASAQAQVEATPFQVARRFCDHGAFPRIAVAFGRPAEQIVEFAEQQ